MAGKQIGIVSSMTLANKIAYRISAWNRERKWRRFLRTVNPGPEMKVLDVGFQDAQYQAADNFIEEHYQWPSMITALGIEEPTHFSKRYPDVNVVVYDGSTFPFGDSSFDVVWSNAVLEHVGDRSAQLQFLRECRRVGGTLFLTTPNKRFPIEVHSRLPLIHWLPERAFDKLLQAANKGQFADGYMNLLTKRDLLALLEEADITNVAVVGNRFLGFTMDYVAISPARD